MFVAMRRLRKRIIRRADEHIDEHIDKHGGEAAIPGEASLAERNSTSLKVGFGLAQFWASGAIALGLAGMLGWIFDVPVLKTLFPGFVTINFNTALTMLICGCA